MRMGLVVPGFVAAAFGLVLCLAASAKFHFTHPRAKDAPIVVDERGARLDLDAIRARQAEQPVAGGLPRAAVPVTDFDFGTMDPLTIGHHDFEIRNVGTAPLVLQQGPTSCKCTLAGLSADAIPPGKSAVVRLEWNTGRTEVLFEQTAVIYTNDPTQRHIALGVRGKVKALIALDHKELVLDAIEPDKAVSRELLLYSQTWNGFEVQGLTSAMAGVTYAAERLSPAQVGGELNPSAAQKITLTIPPTQRHGEFSDTLRFRVRPLDPPGEPVEVTLPLYGKVLRRLAIYGHGIDGDGTIDLGTIPRGAGAKRKFLVKVRDQQPVLHVKELRAEPSFVQASLVPHAGESVPGLYHLMIEVPATVEPCAYVGNPSGRLTIDLDHPRIDDVSLTLLFAVGP
jgi:hypothetical protein